MKTILLTTLLLLFKFQPLLAQLFVSPDYKKTIVYYPGATISGYGIAFNLGYTIAKRLDLGVYGQGIKLNGLFPQHKMGSVGLATKFHLMERKNTLYTGLNTGYIGINRPENHHFFQINAPELGVLLGALIKLGSLKNLKLKTEISYTSVFHRIVHQYLNFGIGFRYLFINPNEGENKF